MQYRQFGSSNFKVSALGFGCMRFPTEDGEPHSPNINEEETINMVRYAIDQGVNFVDTAYPYHRGESEVILGKALKDGYRQKVKLCTKSPLFKIECADDFNRYLHEQLERLQEDYIDYYLLHGINRGKWDDVIGKYNLLEEAEKTVDEGLIGQIGFSFHDSYPVFKEVVDAYPWAMCLLQYNYLDLETQAGKKGVQYAASKGIAVAVMEPLQGGKLAFPPQPVKELLEKSIPGRPYYEWALHWLWDHPEVSVVLSGMSTMEQVKANLVAADQSGINSLSVPERKFLEEDVYQKFRELILVPCTKCHYCMPCPEGVNIPLNLGMLNDGYAFGDLERRRYFYERFGRNAEKCTECRECEDNCPQGIEVSRWMPRVHQVLGEGSSY
ncbi:MAG: aldo/keto reductase [Bacillota bacterium]